MKKLLLSSAFVAVSLLSFAQTPAVPNADFENWDESICGDGVPSQYVSAADMYYAFFETCPTADGIAKSTNKYSGEFALELKSMVTEDEDFGVTIYSGNSVYLFADNFNGRPTKLIGYTKFTRGDSDTLGIFVGIGDENEDEVAYGEITLLNSQSAYTKFEVTLVYDENNSNDPVFLSIGFDLGTNQETGVSPSSVALIDALSFEYSPVTSAVNYSAKSPITVFAANKNINFSEAVSDVHVVDMVGASKMQEAASTKTLNAASLTSGLYVVTYKYNDNYFSKKVVIE